MPLRFLRWTGCSWAGISTPSWPLSLPGPLWLTQNLQAPSRFAPSPESHPVECDLLRAVLDGRLKTLWRLRSLHGFPAPRLDLAEVMAVFEAPPLTLTGLSRTDLRKRLHVNCSTVSLLLGKGMIDSTRVRDPRTRQSMSLIAPEAVDRFLSICLPLGLIAQVLGTQAKHVSARLDKAEVRPIPLPDRCSLICLHSEAAPVIAI